MNAIRWITASACLATLAALLMVWNRHRQWQAADQLTVTVLQQATNASGEQTTVLQVSNRSSGDLVIGCVTELRAPGSATWQLARSQREQWRSGVLLPTHATNSFAFSAATGAAAWRVMVVYAPPAQRRGAFWPPGEKGSPPNVLVGKVVRSPELHQVADPHR